MVRGVVIAFRPEAGQPLDAIGNRPRGIGGVLLRVAEVLRLSPNGLTMFGFAGVCLATFLALQGVLLFFVLLLLAGQPSD